MSKVLRFIIIINVIAASVAVAGTNYRVSSWLPGWSNRHLERTRQIAPYIHESNPVWYQFNSDGTLARSYAAENARWRSAMAGTELIPTIQNTTSRGFDQGLVERVLRTAKTRERHAEEITRLVVKKGYAGIDIDYEMVPTASRRNFTAFIQLLGEKLHARGKKLSVTVYAKRSDRENWDGAGSQDYIAIGKVADSVKLMAYDFHYPGSAAGPITPLHWLDEVITYAKERIPARKIMVGLPFYGYEWQKDSASGITWQRGIERAREAGVKISRDENGEAHFWYLGNVVYFNDAQSYDYKVNLILEKHAEIGGFAHWAVGAEDPAVWNRIARLKHGEASSVTVKPALIESAPQAEAGVIKLSIAQISWIILTMLSVTVIAMRRPAPPVHG